jgi:hypothetical protein
MTTGTLYTIREDLDALHDLLYEAGGDVSEADAEAAVDAWLRETDTAMREKLDAYAALMREIESRAVARKEEVRRLAALAKSDDAAAERLKARLLWFFQDQGLERLETERFRFTVARNGGKAPVQVYCDPEELPEPYRVVSVRPDLEAIRARLEAGETLEFAALGERGVNLRIR